MDAQKRNIWLAAGLISIIAVVIGIFLAMGPNQAKEEADVRTVVTNFGSNLKSISLLSPTETLRSDIEKNYGSFVTESLLQEWRADPSRAPGRTTSSPWPERIEVASVAPQGQGYVASGDIVMMTSTGEAGRAPVVMQLIQENGIWKIAAYQEGQSTSAEAR